MDTTIQQAIFYNTHNNHRNVVKLKYEHVEGAFSILIFGYCVGLLSLIVENVMETCKKRSINNT